MPIPHDTDRHPDRLDRQVVDALARIERTLRRIVYRLAIQEQTTMSTLDDIKQSLADTQREVQESGTAIDGFIAYNQGIKDQLTQLAADAKTLEELKAGIGGLAGQLDAQQGKIATALATTPAGGDVELGEVPAEP